MLHPYLNRAFQRMEGGYYKGAIEDYDRALEIDSTNAEIWLNRGIAREKSNDLKGAFADYTIAIERTRSTIKPGSTGGMYSANRGDIRRLLKTTR